MLRMCFDDGCIRVNFDLTLTFVVFFFIVGSRDLESYANDVYDRKDTILHS